MRLNMQIHCMHITIFKELMQILYLQITKDLFIEIKTQRSWWPRRERLLWREMDSICTWAVCKMWPTKWTSFRRQAHTWREMGRSYILPSLGGHCSILSGPGGVEENYDGRERRSLWKSSEDKVERISKSGWPRKEQLQVLHLHEEAQMWAQACIVVAWLWLFMTVLSSSEKSVGKWESKNIR